MTYVKPELTLIGQASGVVLTGKNLPTAFDHVLGSPSQHYSTALEGEW